MVEPSCAMTSGAKPFRSSPHLSPSEPPSLGGQVRNFDIDPVTRVSGALSFHTVVDLEQRRVLEARTEATLFRGYEVFFRGREPTEAIEGLRTSALGRTAMSVPFIILRCGSGGILGGWAGDFDTSCRVGWRSHCQLPDLTPRPGWPYRWIRLAFLDRMKKPCSTRPSLKSLAVRRTLPASTSSGPFAVSTRACPARCTCMLAVKSCTAMPPPVCSVRKAKSECMRFVHSLCGTRCNARLCTVTSVPMFCTLI